MPSETSEKTGSDSVQKFLDTKGFAEFLAQHDNVDSFDMSNEGEIAKRFETFGKKEVVRKEVKQVWSQHIQEKLGIRLDDTDLADFDSYINKLALTDTDALERLNATVMKFNALPQFNKNLEQQIMAKGGTSENLQKTLKEMREEKDTAVLAEKYSGFASLKVFYNTDAENVRAAFKKKYTHNDVALVKERIEKDIESIGSSLDAVKDLEKTLADSKNSFDASRQALFGEMALFGSIKKGIEEKIKKQMEELLKGNTVRELEKAQVRLEQLKKVADETETGIDPTGGFGKEQTQKLIDTYLEKKTFEEIKGAIETAPLGSGSFSRLEKSLSFYITKESLGTKDHDATREFILKTLKDSSATLGDSVEHKAKKIMIARISAKMTA